MGYIVLGVLFIILYIIEKLKSRIKGEPSDAVDYYYYTVNNYSKSEIRSLRSMPYRKYLETYHWQLLRKAVFKYYGKRCFDCNMSYLLKHLEAHHLTYKNRGHEKIEDLIPLCRSCHKSRHNR